MFIEKIDEQLLKEIQEALDEERDKVISNWDEEFVNLEYEDFNDMLRTEIFEEYLSTPLYMLADLINQLFPFIKEKDISINPSSEIFTSEIDSGEDVSLRVYIEAYDSEKEKLNEFQLKQLDTLYGELTELYVQLGVEATLNITHVPFEDVPEELYTNTDGTRDDENDCNFIQIWF